MKNLIKNIRQNILSSFIVFAFGINAQNVQTAIELEKLNVLYVGIENPIKIVCTEKFDSITYNNGKIITTRTNMPSNYLDCLLFPITNNESIVNLYSSGKCISTKIFRTKRIPVPEIKIAGIYNPEKIKKSILTSIEAIDAGIPGFDFNISFQIIQIEFLGKSKDKIYEYNLIGNSINSLIKDFLCNLDINSKLFMDFKIKGPDGRIISSTVGIKVID